MIRVCPNCKSKNSLPTDGKPSQYGRPVCSKCRADLLPQKANSNEPEISPIDSDFEQEAPQVLLNRLRYMGTCIEFPYSYNVDSPKYRHELEPDGNSPLRGGANIDGTPRNVTVAYTCLCGLPRRLTPIYVHKVEGVFSDTTFEKRIEDFQEGLGRYESISSITRYLKRSEFYKISYESVCHAIWKKNTLGWCSYTLLNECTNCHKVVFLKLNELPFTVPTCKPIGWTSPELLVQIRKMDRTKWKNYLWHEPYITEGTGFVADKVRSIYDTAKAFISSKQ